MQVSLKMRMKIIIQVLDQRGVMVILVSMCTSYSNCILVYIIIILFTADDEPAALKQYECTPKKPRLSIPRTQECVPSKKPHLSFPLLNLKDMSPDEKERLHQRLYAESENMMYNFQKLFTSTRKSLVDRQISVKDLLKHLDCLGSIKPNFEGSELPLLDCKLPELRKSENVDDAMSVISRYCSFFNYRIVEEIIDNVGSEQDKANLKKFKEEFSEYAQRHIFECPAELGVMSEIGHANMFVTLDATYESYTISHLYAFVNNLERVLKIPVMSLRLCRIGGGSLKLIFQLPLSLQQIIFPLSSEQEEALAGLGVEQLSCGDYQFTRQENEVTQQTCVELAGVYFTLLSYTIFRRERILSLMKTQITLTMRIVSPARTHVSEH